MSYMTLALGDPSENLSKEVKLISHATNATQKLWLDAATINCPQRDERSGKYAVIELCGISLVSTPRRKEMVAPLEDWSITRIC